MSGDLPLKANDELRAITNSEWKRDNSVMMSSVIPSTKYSCSGSPLMFWNGSTAIDGLSGNGSGDTAVSDDNGADRGRARYTRTLRVMFFNSGSPRSSKVQSTRRST